jgi:radical SAM superfamily enzyme YgiQ (UPF0313 family)
VGNYNCGREFKLILEKHALVVEDNLIGQRVEEVATQYGVDNLNALFLTHLPGTRLWDQMKSENRIALDAFPQDCDGQP